MGLTFNPISSNFDLTGSGGSSLYFGDPVATEAALPVAGSDGEVRVSKDTDHMYVWDNTSSQWIDSGITQAAFGASPNSYGYSLTSADVGNIRYTRLVLQPADGTNPGGVSTAAQSFAGAKTFLAPPKIQDGSFSVEIDPTSSPVLSADRTITLDINNANRTIDLSGNITVSSDATISGTNTGDVGLASVGSSPNGNGASLSGQTLTLQPADGTNPGLVTAGAQTIGGNKTFSGSISASNLSGTNSGDVSLTAVGSSPNANSASLSGQALTIQPADGTNPGVLTAGVQTIGGNKTFSGSISASNLSGTNSGDVTLSAFGSSPNANGASLTGQALTLQPANSTNPGGVSTSAQSFAGAKTFLSPPQLQDGSFTVALDATSNPVLTADRSLTIDVSDGDRTIDLAGNLTVTNTSSVSNTNTGDVTAAAIGSSPNANGLTVSGQALNLEPANASFGGIVTTTTQTFAGSKTFQSNPKIQDGSFTAELDFTSAPVLSADRVLTIDLSDANRTIDLSGNLTVSSAATVSGTNTGDVSLGAIGSSPNANGATLSGQTLNLEPASASFGGIITTGSQTIAGSKTLSSALTVSPTTNQLVLGATNTTTITSPAPAASRTVTLPDAGTNSSIVLTESSQTINGTKTFSSTVITDGGIDVTATGGTDTLSIGSTNADIINIGRSGITVNIIGTTVNQTVTNSNVTDKNITLNSGGGAGTGSTVGIEVEENSSITGYVETSADRNSWAIKAPNTAGIITVTPGVAGFTLSQGSHDPVTLTAVGSSPNSNAASLSSQAITLQPADGTNPGVLTAGAQTIGGAKTFSSTISASNLSGTNTGDVTLSAFGSSPNSNGASLSGQALTLQPADASNPGGVSTGVQTLAGAKTFSSAVTVSPVSNQLVLGNTNTVTISATAPAASRTITIPDVSANADVVLTAGNQTLGGNKEFSNPPRLTDGSFYTTIDFTSSPVLSANRALNIDVNDSDRTLDLSGNLTVSSAATISGTNSGDVSFTAVGSSPNANGASLSSQAITLQPADGTNPGLLTAGAQTIGGAKTFSSSISASNLSGTNSGDVTITAVGSSPNANAASLSGQALTIQPADGTNPGVLTAGTQTIGGAKTFSSTISASNLSGTNSGDVTVTSFGSTPNNDGISLSGQAITLQPADSSHPGGLSTSSQTIAGAKTFNSVVTITPTTNQLVLGVTNTTTISATAPSTSRTITIPDPTTVGAAFVLTKADQVIDGNKEFSNPPRLTDGSFYTTIDFTSSPVLSANRALNLDINDADRTIDLSGNLTVSSAATISGTNSGDVSLTAVGSSPNANGASLSSQALTLQPADGTNPGLLTAGTQTIGGAKTFSSTISASNLSGTNTGNVTLGAIGSSPNANGATLSSQALNLEPASASFGGVVTTGSQTFAGDKTFTGVIRTNTNLVLEDPGAGSNTTTIQAGVVSAGYTLTLPTAVSTINGAAITSDTSGNLSYTRVVTGSAGDIAETSFSAAASQTNASITGFSLSSVRSFRAQMSIFRSDNLAANYELKGIYNGTTWYMTQDYIGDDTGYTFDITSAGQVRYTSPAFTATIKFRALVTTT